ncbi:hypothetical protein DOY81_002379, partial [Sarcophaga bullata]
VRISIVLLITIAHSNALTMPQLCKSKNFGYKIQDPEDCHSFYVCLGSLGQFTLDCGSGYRFNETEQKCVKGKCPPCPCVEGYNGNSVHITELISTLPYHLILLQQDAVPQEFTNIKENVKVSEDQQQKFLRSNSKILKTKQNINLLEIFPNSADTFGIKNSNKSNKVFLGKSAALSISTEKYDELQMLKELLIEDVPAVQTDAPILETTADLHNVTIRQSSTVTTTSDTMLPNEIIKDTIGENFDLINDNNMSIPTEYTTQTLRISTTVPNTKIEPDLSTTTETATTTNVTKIEKTAEKPITTIESTTTTGGYAKYSKANTQQSTMLSTESITDTSTQSATESTANESKTTLETTTSEVKIEPTSTIASTTVASTESTAPTTSATVPDTTTEITTKDTTTESITQNPTTTAAIAEITTTEISTTTSTTKTCTSTTACTSTTGCPSITTITATRPSTISCPTTTKCTATETMTTYATTIETRSTTIPSTTTSTTVTCSTTTTKTCTTMPTTTTSTTFTCKTITCTLPHTTSTCASKASGSETSEVEYLCSNKENGYFIKDSMKCKRYYTCYNKRAYPQICPGRFHFDDQSKMCNYPELVNCQDEKENPQNTKPLTVGLKHRLSKQQITSTAVSLTPIDCKILKSGTFIRDLSNCNKYYVCLNDNAVALYCPRGQYFDIEKLVCNFKTLVKNCQA